MADAQVVKRDEQAVCKAQAPETEAISMPDVDISEDGERVRLLADMPGVDPKSVDVSVENGVLTIAGQADVEGPPGHGLVGQEYRVGRYRRDFTLSDAVNVGGITARMQHGVLEVTFPKREAVKTRRVKIET
jgi:HSP20 family protein